MTMSADASTPEVYAGERAFAGLGGTGRELTRPVHEMSDEALIRSAAEGDVTSREILATRWLGRAYAAALSKVGNAADAEDIVQEAFYRAFRKLARLKDPSRFGPWLLQIVRNAARDLHRRSGRSRPLTAEAELPATAGSEPDGSAVAAWRTLPDDQRLVCWLKVMDGLPFRDIAALLGCSKSAAYRLYTKGIARLRRELSRC